ncbi:hypothetical protein HG535_0H03250 [Zygotorulaspora mrakii]|uniref:Vacuolar protein sorting-associated protein 52 n=1 Tax=Zygotorulaspora mrakii TaxID=42260 RepID=A0A7H9B8B6_ZYGMR|nr:uncharacterized protein HG535_0H03250 [Zygotorulaspora mrakii]QLG74998.1 hypothetical protein HG535_0H03250 [Zygotorulaspora mrakii]
MEELGTVLGVDIKELSLKSANSSGDDALSNFLNDYHTQRYQANNSLWDELKNLEEDHQQVQTTLESVIPPIREYIENFNLQLSEFTNDLGFIRNKSSELKSLLEYNSVKLANISPLVNDLMISPSVIKDIIHSKINSSWIENIAYIKDKQEIYLKYKQDNEIAVPKDFGQLCQVLNISKEIVLERSKKFIIREIKKLRGHQPVPCQPVQNEMIKVKEIFQFIVENNYSLALELRQAYSYSMRWYYKAYFSRYIRSLTILQFKMIDAQYALGNGLSNTSFKKGSGFAISSYLTTTYGRTSVAVTDESIQDYFQISKRLSLLTQEDNTVMVSQIAENNTMQNYVEVGFKNLNLAILDNCTVEYKFLKEFFLIKSNEQELKGIIEQVFQYTFDEALEYTKQLFLNTYDIFGVLISIRIAQQLQFESQRRKMPVVEEYLNAQLMLLWPKFQQLVDFQCESLRRVSITTNVANIFGKATQRDPLTTPHELTVQFAKFLTSFLTLAITHEDQIDERSEPLYNSIIRVRNDFETVMTKCSKKTKSPERMLATNYMYLYNSLQHQHTTLQIYDSASLPLILKETEDHFKALVEAFSNVK